MPQNEMDPNRAGANRSQRRAGLQAAPMHLAGFLAATAAVETPQNQAELFYLQKQIQAQTPMVLVLENGEKVEGVIEWYDRNAIKIRGRARTMVYKSAIKYMYKQGEPV